jgi:hypothetical protein
METIQLSLLCNDDDCSVESRSKADNQLSLLCDDDDDDAFLVDTYDDESQLDRAEI